MSHDLRLERVYDAAPEVVFDAFIDTDASLLEIIDHVLNKGVMLHGELFLGVAGVDLVYLRLSAMLCALPRASPPTARTRSRISGA